MFRSKHGLAQQSVVATLMCPSDPRYATVSNGGDFAFFGNCFGLSSYLAVEGSSDAGVTWVAKGGFWAGTSYTGSTTTTPAILEGIAAGVNRIRVR